MGAEPSPALAGFFRVLYFLAAAAVAVAVVITGVVSFYEAPDGGEFRFEEDSAFEESNDQQDYNRNFGLIHGLVGTAFMATGILALGSRFNPLRSGLLVAGLVLFGVGVSFAVNGSDDWLAFLVSFIAFLTVVGSVLWVEEGLPVGGGAAPTWEPPPPPPEPPTEAGPEFPSPP